MSDDEQTPTADDKRAAAEQRLLPSAPYEQARRRGGRSLSAPFGRSSRPRFLPGRLVSGGFPLSRRCQAVLHRGAGKRSSTSPFAEDRAFDKSPLYFSPRLVSNERRLS
jgi:hypothetical protein